MKNLIIFYGESFRFGGQSNRNIGLDKSFAEQIKACDSHLDLIKKLELKHKIDVYIDTYDTKFSEQLLEKYKNHLIGFNLRKQYTQTVNRNILDCLNQVQDIYEYIFLIRIDLFLKPDFINLFPRTSDKITFTFRCWKLFDTLEGYPRISGMIFVFPQKYLEAMKSVDNFEHDTWLKLRKQNLLENHQLEFLISSQHDSDSQKDWNPLYYVVNRPEKTPNHNKFK
jgi:hypothetical protein